MPPRIVFGGGGIGGTATSFTYAWDTPDKVAELLKDLKRIGIDQIDSAGSYPPGNAGDTERLLGEAHAALPEGGSFIIDSKVAVHNPGPKLTSQSIERSLGITLTKLGVPKINIFYAHGPDVETPMEETAAGFDRQFRAGKFEKLGLSNYTVEQLTEYFSICQAKGYVKPSVVQDHYNALSRGHEDKLIPLLRQHGCAYYAYSPLAGGFLTGKVTQAYDSGDAKVLERTRWVDGSEHKMYRRRFENDTMHEAVRAIMKACEAAEPPMTMAEASLRWLMFHSALKQGDGIIVGASKVPQLEANVRQALGGPLPKAVLDVVESLWTSVQDVKL